jgi:hypothetical protein
MPLPDVVLRVDGGMVQHTILTLHVAKGTTVGYLFDRVDAAFAGGVNAVWVVFPNVEHVYCYSSSTDVHILSRGEELTGEPIVPGFRLALNDLFPPPDEPVDAAAGDGE